MGDDFVGKTISIIEMNDKGTLFAHKEPMDWILFNKILGKLRKGHHRHNFKFGDMSRVFTHLLRLTRIF